jgi:hypothetical protein
MPTMMLPRAAFRIAASLAVLVFTGATMGATPAAPVERVGTEGSCSASAEVIRWTPKNGPPARFVADTIMAHGSDLFIGLGYTDDAFWSVEGKTPNDACDDCALLDLVATSLSDGKRRTWPVLSAKDRDALGGAVKADIHAHVLRRLFHLAKGPWPAEDLQHDYTFRLPERNAGGVVKHDDAWFVEVQKPRQWRLLFDLDAKTEMCWCFWDWRAKKAAP